MATENSKEDSVIQPMGKDGHMKIWSNSDDIGIKHAAHLKFIVYKKDADTTTLLFLPHVSRRKQRKMAAEMGYDDTHFVGAGSYVKTSNLDWKWNSIYFVQTLHRDRPADKQEAASQLLELAAAFKQYTPPVRHDPFPL